VIPVSKTILSTERFGCSVVIRCYNEEQHIGRLIHGILQQTTRDVEIIVVDSGSKDGTLAIVSRYPVKIIKISADDFSFGYSLNFGCKAASGEFIAIVSAHVYPLHRDWLEHLLSPFDDPKVALVYGKQRGNEKTKYSEHQIFKKWFPNEPHSNQDHPFCNNANAAIRRSVWERLPYDQTLTGIEDLDWAKRALQLGYKIAYEPDAEVIHVHNESPLQTYNRYRREAIALKRIFPSEQFHFSDFLRLFLTNIFNDYVHARGDGVFGHQWVGIPRFRLMQFWGTYRGFSQSGPVTHQLKQTFYYPNRKGRQDRRRKPVGIKNRPRVDYHNNERSFREDH
jgi:glycosyltransferase involved in cell wall biosynthesis